MNRVGRALVAGMAAIAVSGCSSPGETVVDVGQSYGLSPMDAAKIEATVLCLGAYDGCPGIAAC